MRLQLLSRRAAVAAVFILLTCGCATTPEFKAPTIAPLDPALRATESTCVESDVTRCALGSPLHTIADKLEKDGAHSVTLLEIGEQALAARIHLIRSARSSIDIQTYIWSDDEVGRLVMSELLEAARRGVTVRIIADQLYSGGTPENLALLALAHRNLEIRLYNPLGQEAVSSLADKIRGVFMNFGVLNHRMHNKLMVFDKRIAVTGGRNIENKYFDYDPVFNFIDRDVLVVGDVALDMSEVFETYWRDPIVVGIDRLTDVRAELERINYQLPGDRLELGAAPLFAPLISKATDTNYIEATFIAPAFAVGKLHYSADRPQKPYLKDLSPEHDSSAQLRKVVSGAKSRLTVQTPYFILSRQAAETLESMREANPAIEYSIVTNSLASTDQYLVYALSYKRKKRNIDKLGFQIFELNPFPRDVRYFLPRFDALAADDPGQTAFEPIDVDDMARGPVFAPVPVTGTGPRLCIHAKSLVVDGRIGVVGSHNFDPRSSAINTESVLIVWDDDFATALEQNIRRVAVPGNAWVAAPRQTVPLLGHMGRFFAAISRALPFFDVWPFRYTSNFELKPGKDPVPHTHPDFYENYTDVGQFPGTSLGGDQLKTYLVSAFGAVVEPQL